ncbi:MAG: hypothetical protein ACI95C_002643 [Pseudohongiellaceae bacterium]|jgi:hypothetical protein
MSLKVIELNDAGIKIGTAQGIVAESPGFAIVFGDNLVLGAQAEQQARLHPTSSYNKYWHELSMEALNHGNHLRHTADIAFAHLLHLAEIGEVDAETIFAMPSSYSHQQLAILLGIAKKSPITPVGVVDTAVLAAVAAGISSSALYIDFQLHQVVVTQLSVSEGLIHCEAVVQIPGVGSQNFVNLIMQQATNSFIEQCRFNPQHNAEYEQLLYNQLPVWLEQYNESQTNLVLELKTRDATHTAKMPKEGLIASLQGYYKKIAQELAPLIIDSRTQIILNKRLGSMPGFLASLPSDRRKVVLKPHDICQACINSAENIVHHSGSIHWVKSLPAKFADDSGKLAGSDTELGPTHFLLFHTAIPLAGLNQYLPDSIISSPDESVFVDSKTEFSLNDRLVSGRQRLRLGDTLDLGSNQDRITIIRVSDGQH